MEIAASSGIKRIVELFAPDDRVLVAFSGGVDSSFLIYVLKHFSDIEMEAVTIKTPYIPQWEADEAIAFCKTHNITHKVLTMSFPGDIKHNPEDRCYRCKHILFSKIKEYAAERGYNIIADGSNADDTSDHRPGMKALKELYVLSPLLEAGLAKKEIRSLLKELKLEIWNKPAYACLLTRIPHNTAVEANMLHIIEEAEQFLKKLGFAGTRVRLHNDIARLEPRQEDIEKMCRPGTRDSISNYLKRLGIKYITLDLEGYRTGSMNKK